MFEKCIYFNSNTLARTVNRLWKQAYSQFDLSPSHAYLLRLILSQPGLTPHEVAVELDLTRSTITRFLNSLEARGYLLRQDSDSDGRGFKVYPTEKAQALHADLNKTAAMLTKEVQAALGEQTFAATVEKLKEVKRILD